MTEYQRRLPHFHPDGEYLFVTWRLHGSLPVAPPDIIYATPGHAFAAEDRALAQGRGRLWLSDTRVARQVVEAIRAGESRKFYELSAFVVMPNHVHLLILPNVGLPQITHWIKGRTARDSAEKRRRRKVTITGARRPRRILADDAHGAARQLGLGLALEDASQFSAQAGCLTRRPESL
jgi:hypothetical protein